MYSSKEILITKWCHIQKEFEGVQIIPWIQQNFKNKGKRMKDIIQKTDTLFQNTAVSL